MAASSFTTPVESNYASIEGEFLGVANALIKPGTILTTVKNL